MLHSDIVPEHLCNGELIEVDQSSTRIRRVWCSSCRTEFTFEPDSDWVTFVTPGMTIRSRLSGCDPVPRTRWKLGPRPR